MLDPSKLAPFSVIHCPVTLEGEWTYKRFVVISHRAEYVICLKATSKVERYFADQQLLDGVLSYKAGDCACFECDTVIQPDNQFPISYKDLVDCDARGELKVLGDLPRNAKEQLINAVRNSYTMAPRKQERLLGIL